jgi:hypothetical protein
VPGAALDLSHWRGNGTPARFKRDTSTEIALAYAAVERSTGGLVVNNHFDADGALSVFALLEPDRALERAPLLAAAAECGDFGEWPDDDGVRLCFAIEALGARARDDEGAYALVLAMLPALVARLAAHADLWAPPWERLAEAAERARAGEIAVRRAGETALVVHAASVELPAPLLGRLAAGARRWLVGIDHGAGRFAYRYERPGHAWADTVVRPPVPPPPRERFARLGADWELDEVGMTGIARTRAPVRLAPDAALALCTELESA